MAFRMVVTNGRVASFNSVGSIIFPEYASPPIPLSATKQVSLLSSTLFPVRVINFSALKGTSLRKSSTVMFFSTLEIFGVTYRKETRRTVIVASPLLSDVVVSPLLLAIVLSITRKAQSKIILSPSEKYSASLSPYARARRTRFASPLYSYRCRPRPRPRLHQTEIPTETRSP